MKRLLARLAATSLACTFGRCDRCLELVHRNPFGLVTWCRCTRRTCRHRHLIAVKEAAS